MENSKKKSNSPTFKVIKSFKEALKALPSNGLSLSKNDFREIAKNAAQRAPIRNANKKGA